MKTAIIFLTGASLVLPMLGIMALFSVGCIVIWESLRGPIIQLWKWVRP